MKKINVGIIGRNFGYNVIFNAIKNDKSFNIIGFSFNKKKKIKVLPKKIKIYKNWKYLISDKKIDSIIISSPPKTHKKIIKFAIKKNKNIFCEKPVTTSLKDISSISEMTSKKHIVKMVNYEFSNIEAFKKFKRNYLSRIKIKRININWFLKIKKNKRSSWKDNHSLGGGIYFNYICHVLYYLENLFGKISFLDSSFSTLKKNNNFRFNFLLEKKNINIILNFKIINNKRSNSFHRINIYSNKGNYVLETKISNLTDQFYLRKKNKILFKPKNINYDFRLKPTYENLKKFKNSIILKKNAFPNFDNAKRIHYLINKMTNLS